MSRQTVSRVINRASNVSAAARTRVEAAIAELAYVPNLAARRMGGGRSYTLLVLMEAGAGDAVAELPLGDMLLAGMAACSSAGYHLMFDQVERRMGVGESGEGFAGQLGAVLGSVQPDGVVVLPPLDDWAPIHALLAARAIPTACLGERSEFGRTVPGLDHAALGEAAAAHLVALGHRQVGFVGGSARSPVSLRRIEGYRRALAKAGSRAHRHFVAEAPEDYASALALARSWLTPTIRPTAIIADSAMMALAFHQVAGEMRIAVPRDLSLLALTDAPALARARPAISAMHLPLSQMFAHACERLIASGEAAAAMPGAQFAERESIARAPRAV